MHTLWICSKSLNCQWTAAIFQQQYIVRIGVRLKLLQLMNTALCCMANGIQIPMTQAAEEVNGWICQPHFGSRTVW